MTICSEGFLCSDFTEAQEMLEDQEKIKKNLDNYSEYTRYFTDNSPYKASDLQIQEYILYEVNELEKEGIFLKQKAFRSYLIKYYKKLCISDKSWSKNIKYLYKNDYIKLDTQYKTKPYVVKSSNYYLPEKRSFGMSKADMIFEICMGNNSDLRKAFITDNAKFHKQVDI
tara:strand:- start:167 stop:676 length:510 start_codon:yes stop_codon:yes gene_type:complete